MRTSVVVAGDVHITVKVVATGSALTALLVAIALTLIYTLLSQHCHYHYCSSAVTISAVLPVRDSSCVENEYFNKDFGKTQNPD